MDISYDLIVVARSDNDELISMTKECIESAGVHTIVVETGMGYNYDAEIIRYEGDFNYHRALNMGVEKAKGDIYILANNDIIFYPGWDEIGKLMYLNGFDSASAWSSDYRQKDFERGDFVYPGYRVGYTLTGWCIFITSTAYQKIGKLDESVRFWYSDDIYAEQLKANNLRHGLFTGIRVEHRTSMTLNTLPRSLQVAFTSGQKNIYAQRKRHIKINS
ncbi:MAG TPA: hypothetical protein P5523_04950 [Bacteroidales bacterium]|jgi:glycosyltransferase involved in cell wall biosynthesis|nr:hypothetical protein [Bacteroidales bacterium]